MASFTISPAEHMEFIRNGGYDDAKIKQLIDNGTLEIKVLLGLKVLTQADIDRIMFISPEEHMENIRNNFYSSDTIRGLIRDGKISETELKRRQILTAEQLDIIMGRPVPHMVIDFDWKDVPALIPDRVDVFVLGIAGCGKSCFMAGLIYCAEKYARINFDQKENMKGYTYARKLIDAVEWAQTPPPTPDEYVQYMACDFMEENSRDPHPLTFIEMSGENFTNAFGMSKEKLHPKFREYLFDSPNNKIVFLTIDYEAHEERKRLPTSQRAQFDFILRFLHDNGTLENTEAISILIMKWDRSPDQSPEAAKAFLRKEYFSLYRLCEDYQKEHNLKFEVFTFSLGKFDRMGRYTYDETDSLKLLNWLSNFSPIRRERRRGRWGR